MNILIGVVGLVLLIIGIVSGNWLMIVAGAVLLAIAFAMRTPRVRA